MAVITECLFTQRECELLLDAIQHQHGIPSCSSKDAKALSRIIASLTSVFEDLNNDEIKELYKDLGHRAKQRL